MKIIISGDWHIDASRVGRINPSTDLDFRTEDFLAAIDYMIDYAIKINADLFIMNGDLFKGRTSSHHIETLVAERFRKIATKMPLIINLGNHDYTGKTLTYGFHTYSIIERFQIQNVSINTNISHIPFEQVDLVLYPYFDCKSREGFLNNQELLSFIKNSIDKYPLSKKTKLFVGHGTPEGTMANDSYFFELDSVDEPILPQSMFEPYDMVFFSHIHRCQRVTDKIFHIGSPERVDFAEANEEKGFVVVDTTNNSYEFVSTNPRPMAVLDLSIESGDFVDPTQEIIQAIGGVQDLSKSMLKVSVSCSEQSRMMIDSDQVQKALDKSYFSLPIKYQVSSSEKITRMSEITEALSELEALEKVIAASDLSDSEKTQLLIRGKGILASNEA